MEKDAKQTETTGKEVAASKPKYKVVGLKESDHMPVSWQGYEYNLANLGSVPDEVLAGLVKSKYPHLIAE